MYTRNRRARGIRGDFRRYGRWEALYYNGRKVTFPSSYRWAPFRLASSFHSVSLCAGHVPGLVTSCHTRIGDVIGAGPASKPGYMLMVPLHDETAVRGRSNHDHHLTEDPGTSGTMLPCSMPTPCHESLKSP